MLISTKYLLQSAMEGGYAIGAFNIYNLEGAKAVALAAEAERSPAIIQIHPGAYKYGGLPLFSLALSVAQQATAPISVHLDHSTSKKEIRVALEAGLSSVMADGSKLSYEANVAFTKDIVSQAHPLGVAVEAELGRISGTEDNLTVHEFEAKYTSVEQSVDFVNQTNVDALAICIGNVHGKYPSTPNLDFVRLAKIHQCVPVPLVLHGASGLPANMIKKSIELGVRKFNVNTEIRKAYLETINQNITRLNQPDLLPLINLIVDAMQITIANKMRLFGSTERASHVIKLLKVNVG